MDEREEKRLAEGDQEMNDKYPLPVILDIAVKARQDLLDLRREIMEYHTKNCKRDPTWLNSTEVAKMLSISERSLRRYRLMKQVRYRRMNRICKYYYPDLLKLIK